MEKIVVFVLCLCLFIGGSNHIFDNLYYGFLPYKYAPLWVNVYWTSLAVMDLLAVYLLVKYRKAGLVLTLIIMFSDVVINSTVGSSIEVIFGGMNLQLQTLFLGFCIGSSGWLWQLKVQPNVANVT